MSDSRQFTINFDEWEIPVSSSSEERPHTPANPDHPSATLRNLIQSDEQRNRPINYVSFGSGSSGNSCYIGNSEGGIIIDCGVNPSIIQSALEANGVPMTKVKALCLTHDHSDHVRYAYKLLRSHKHLRLYCTNRVLNALLRRHGISKRIKDYHQPIFKEFPFKIAGFEITAFDVPHDAADNAGFCFQLGDKRFVMATDLGAISERAAYYMKDADFLMIEANYDRDMLRNGPYPEYLKVRIATDVGHLDNRDTAGFLNSITPGRLRYVFLCHLSNDNNTPEKALATIRTPLVAKGLTIGEGNDTITDRAADLQLLALPRHQPTRWFVLR